jgi:hypothetical protein
MAVLPPTHGAPPTATSIFESYASCQDPVYVRKTSFCNPNRDTCRLFFVTRAPVRFTRTRSRVLVGSKSPISPATLGSSRPLPALSQRGSATKFHVSNPHIFHSQSSIASPIIFGSTEIVVGSTASRKQPHAGTFSTIPLRQGSLALSAP